MSFDWSAGQLFINELIVLNNDLTKMEKFNSATLKLDMISF